MPDRLLARAAMATLLCLTTTVVTAQTPSPVNAEQGWASITRCAQEDSERARHTCLDRVLRDAGLLTNEMHAQQQRKAFGLDEKAVRTPPAPKPAPTPPVAAATSTVPAATPSAPTPRAAATPSAATAPAATTTPPAAVAGQPDVLEAELAKVDKAANGRIVVTTTDGAVWLQAESVDMPQLPMKGDRMTIRKGSMGGYRCSVTSTHLTYRCVRSR